MGTKNDPGKFDCYANANPEEPMFVLLGRDPDMALLVTLWALLRHRRGNPDDDRQVLEALDCARDAHRYAHQLGKLELRDAKLTEELLLLATNKMDEHPDGYDDSCQCDLCLSYA